MTKKIPLRITQEVAPAKMGKQNQIGERSENGRTAAISCQRQSDRQAHLVGKPLGHDGNDGPVTKSVADAAQHAVEKIEKVQAGRIAKKGKNSA